MRSPRTLRATAVTAAVALTVGAVIAVGGAGLADTATPPGAPGAAATWTTGDKEGLGTAVTGDSKVWYTLTGGTLSEVYYPSGDTPNVRSLGFAVTDGSTFTQRETDNTSRTVRLASDRALTYVQTSTDNAGRWRLTKTYVTDPGHSALAIDVRFDVLKGGPYQLYALYDPSLAGSAQGDSGRTVAPSGGQALIAEDQRNAANPVATALVSSTGFEATSSGYAGSVSDPAADLAAHHRLTTAYASAPAGNIVQAGQVRTTGSRTRVMLTLAFGGTGAQALDTARQTGWWPFDALRAWYEAGWLSYIASLRPAPAFLHGEQRTQYMAALMAIRAHEDKTFPGAFIASLTIPWGQAVDADGTGGGYHFVWARDLYEQVTGLLAAGDTAAAQRAVRWLFTRQQQPDGHFPQNSRADGTPDQTNVQLDETAYPIILAYQTGAGAALYRDGVKRAADYLVAHGPITPQERWEETGGYSPSTIAAEIAGLTCAAALARGNGDDAAAAVYQATADSWQRNVQRWMYTTTGNLSDGRYYVRINANGTPDDGATRGYANGAGVHAENSVVDAGFLELVRLGVKAPDDSAVARSLAAVDESIAVATPSGTMWKRYTFDGYGESADGGPWAYNKPGTIGRPWPLLSGERGEYVLANHGDASGYLQTIANSANAGYMIPEQVWDSPDPTAYGHVFGEGTGSAAPLSWAMAQYVRLAQGIAAGRPVETPEAVAHRYAGGRALSTPALAIDSPADASTATSKSITVSGTSSASVVYVDVNGQRTKATVSHGRFSQSVALTGMRNHITVAAVAADGGTNAATRDVLAFGDRLGGITDPTGDDHGPGSYVYPTDGAFNPGAFDITRFDAYRDADTLRLVTRVAGPINNPWGGNGMSVQRLNVYLRTDQAATTTAQPALPGTNVSTDQAWQLAVVGDGRYPDASYATGAYNPAGTRVAAVTLSVLPATHDIVLSLPLSALGGADPAHVRYAVAMFSDAEAGEGIGNVRPVYSLDNWNNGPWWVKQFRFGGGAGVLDDSLPSRDTDTRDGNAIDITTGPGQSQARLLDWTDHTPVIVPLHLLNP